MTFIENGYLQTDDTVLIETITSEISSFLGTKLTHPNVHDIERCLNRILLNHGIFNIRAAVSIADIENRRVYVNFFKNKSLNK